MSVYPVPPSSTTPHWADAGTNTVEPTESKKSAGWALSESPASGFMNWIQSTALKWVGYFKARKGAAFCGDGTDGDGLITGTVAWAGGSNVVTGTGTHFAAWMVGCSITLGYASTQTPQLITSVNVAAQTLTTYYSLTGGGAGQGYALALNADYDFVNLSIDAGNVLINGNWRVRYTGTATVNGAIGCNGADGSPDYNVDGSRNGVQGTAFPSHSLVGGVSGTAGATTTSVGGVNPAPAPGQQHMLGGLGGLGYNATGPSWSGSYGLATSESRLSDLTTLTTGHYFYSGAACGIAGGGGGAGGGAASPNGVIIAQGAGGGAGAGTVLLVGNDLVVGSTLQNGTLSGNSSNVITGTGTNFLTLTPGTVISVNGTKLMIKSITSATSMVVNKGTGTFTGQAWSVVGAMTAVGGTGGPARYLSDSGWCAGGGGGGAILNTAMTISGTMTYLVDGGPGGIVLAGGSSSYWGSSGYSGTYVETIL